jgi:hypothetical protein
MSKQASKKHKAMMPEEIKQMGLSKAFGVWSSTAPIFTPKSFVSSIKKDKIDPHLLFASTYFADVDAVAPMLIPPLLSAFSIKRASNGTVVSISDEKSKIQGESLSKIQAIQYLWSKGHSHIIAAEDIDGDSEVLGIESMVLVEETSETARKKAHLDKYHVVYTPRSKIYVFVPKSEILKLLELSSMPLGKIKHLLEKLNKIWEKVPYELKPELHGDLSALITRLATPLPTVEEAFISALVAAQVAN